MAARVLTACCDTLQENGCVDDRTVAKMYQRFAVSTEFPFAIAQLDPRARLHGEAALLLAIASRYWSAEMVANLAVFERLRPSPMLQQKTDPFLSMIVDHVLGTLVDFGI